MVELFLLGSFIAVQLLEVAIVVNEPPAIQYIPAYTYKIKHEAYYGDTNKETYKIQ